MITLANMLRASKDQFALYSADHAKHSTTDYYRSNVTSVYARPRKMKDVQAI